MTTLGAVLAGGRSSRFGSDKALAMLDGRTLLDHALAALRPHCDAVIVVGRGEIADWPRADMGPLGGVAGALIHAADEGFDQVLTAPVDCVRLPGDLRALLEPAPAFLETQPVIGLWPVAALRDLRSMLEDADDLAVKAFARRIGARPVTSDFVPPNINSAADLDRLAGS
ncbi:molybdenum cofactor guanylyltransferase [Sphingopyxis sp. H038]|uniref:molybdenum cofactor guanylyltransferase n=1 Tax=unclassified Sphingopyxis TaxID=2614943 RepID=UPI0007303DF4|nr:MULTISPECIES: molybdenum cofactor guanylyltransferase [unclassified Sphingopyxis]KTE00253.1 molybdenum cofactor guanylyltransferase [Sphingopyxis sp. H012]KTE06421.1 molybdenum cofactor guanylyltransferase [Sphingopyxis sp. H053]KTE07241.1 molybdenum cofactor guanylyltransferase [Sphingopyxis sp. H093]KTE28884.1 molybdenum cofactor guanylyltransferase [Sphingopyxis sp. H080]KTE31659.1 molybdenum cofactor guanylyltransferase [Sphingopyxis sp. H038]